MDSSNRQYYLHAIESEVKPLFSDVTMSDLYSLAVNHANPLRMFLAASVLALLWAIESITTGDSFRKRLRHLFRNLSLAGINGAVLFFSLGLLTVVIAEFVEKNDLGLLPLLPVPIALKTLIAFVVLDGWTYFWHRANHRWDFLWRFHRVHHSDAEMDVSTSARFHVGELTMAALCRLPVVILFGIGPFSLLLHEVALVAVSQFHHSRLALGRVDTWLSYLIVTPRMHRIHHSIDAGDMHTNFASVLSLWDRLFGTVRSKDASKVLSCGIQEFNQPQWQTLPGMLCLPFAPLEGSIPEPESEYVIPPAPNTAPTK